MPKDAKKLLENQSLGVSARVTSERMQRAGVSVSADVLGSKPQASKSAAALSRQVIKRLAGG
jgi:hypothetical protein